MPTIVHFDIASEDVNRAKKFYESLFEWKITMPPGMSDYYLLETTDLEGKQSIGGGIGKRENPDQKITLYIGVENIERYCRKIEELGGKVIQPELPVPGWGSLAVCMDTEGNLFGLWQEKS